ncbi:hypothetical protein A2U01_0029185 [Trifolium medium]|uniref:Uncharacterized protein n=1 Tax=Trifolium medium TaxID=97028 RepID=A0A392P8P6_9FABA|nr:hypothetical protein [Trifolium medium]
MLPPVMSEEGPFGITSLICSFSLITLGASLVISIQFWEHMNTMGLLYLLGNQLKTFNFGLTQTTWFICQLLELTSPGPMVEEEQGTLKED